jgi:hypothetical protein
MPQAKCTEDEFVELWNRLQSPIKVANALGLDVRNVMSRRRAIEFRRCIKLDTQLILRFPQDGVRVNAELENGILIVGSDAHYWPGIRSAAHRALVVAIRELKPKMYCLNGDGFDGAAAGRHGRIMWEAKPNVKQELDAVKERNGEIEEEIKDGALHWNWGNHDQRFSTKLSSMVPEFEGVHGFDLKNHFPRWKFGMSLMVNDHTMIKHRWHNGVHATWNNIVKSGVSMVTGHLHALQVRPYTDYNGSRYAVDTGTLACPTGPQFTYAEDNPANHRSGFAVLTFHRGKLLPPELLEVIDEDAGLVCFRGQVVQV